MGKGSTTFTKYFQPQDETLKTTVTNGLQGVSVNSLKLACGRILGPYSL